MYLSTYVSSANKAMHLSTCLPSADRRVFDGFIAQAQECGFKLDERGDNLRYPVEYSETSNEGNPPRISIVNERSLYFSWTDRAADPSLENITVRVEEGHNNYGSTPLIDHIRGNYRNAAAEELSRMLGPYRGKGLGLNDDALRLETKTAARELCCERATDFEEVISAATTIFSNKVKKQDGVFQSSIDHEIFGNLDFEWMVPGDNDHSPEAIIHHIALGLCRENLDTVISAFDKAPETAKWAMADQNWRDAERSILGRAVSERLAANNAPPGRPQLVDNQPQPEQSQSGLRVIIRSRRLEMAA